MLASWPSLVTSAQHIPESVWPSDGRAGGTTCGDLGSLAAGALLRFAGRCGGGQGAKLPPQAQPLTELLTKEKIFLGLEKLALSRKLRAKNSSVYLFQLKIEQVVIPRTAWLLFPKQSTGWLRLAAGTSSLSKVSILLVKQETGCEDSFCLVPSLSSFV